MLRNVTTRLLQMAARFPHASIREALALDTRGAVAGATSVPSAFYFGDSALFLEALNNCEGGVYAPRENEGRREGESSCSSWSACWGGGGGPMLHLSQNSHPDASHEHYPSINLTAQE